MPATLVLERWAANWKMGSDVVPGAARLLWNATKQHAILGQILIMTCGLAAHMEEALITPNVEHEPCWQPWLWLAREYGYRACWSFPVRTFGGPILGTLAWYFKDPREPSLRMMELAATLTQRYYGAQAGRGPAQDPQYRTGAVQQGHGGTGTPDDGVQPQEPWAAGVAE